MNFIESLNNTIAEVKEDVETAMEFYTVKRSVFQNDNNESDDNKSDDNNGEVTSNG